MNDNFLNAERAYERDLEDSEIEALYGPEDSVEDDDSVLDGASYPRMGVSTSAGTISESLGGSLYDSRDILIAITRNISSFLLGSLGIYRCILLCIS